VSIDITNLKEKKKKRKIIFEIKEKKKKRKNNNDLAVMASHDTNRSTLSYNRK